MRIGVFHGSPYYLRFYEDALALLVRRGHTLVLAAPDDRERIKPPAALRSLRSVETVLYPAERGDGNTEIARLARTARDALRFLTPELDDAPANRDRAFGRLGALLGTDGETALRAARELDASGRTAVDAALQAVEGMLPADERITRLLRKLKLDVVVVISRFNIGSAQTEIVKAAAAADIPSGVIAYSWDNLTNKGLLHVQPDRLFVWNAVQLDEAERLHGVAHGRVVVTGAPRFDALFAAPPRPDPARIADELGLPAARRLVLYVGSSTFVAPREPEFVDRWAAALRAADDPDVAGANIVVRPHPGTVKEHGAWRSWRPAQREGFAVAGPGFPPEQDLLDQIAASDAVVGLNTSAELEAAILDKPVLTVGAGDVAPGQEGSVHFRYLLAGNDDGAVAAAASLDEHVAQLSEALARDPLAAARKRFLQSFLRPHGLDVPASPLLADAIEELGPRRVRRFGRHH